MHLEETKKQLPDNLTELQDECERLHDIFFATPNTESVAAYNEAAEKYNSISGKKTMSLITIKKTNQMAKATKVATTTKKPAAVKKAAPAKKPAPAKVSKATKQKGLADGLLEPVVKKPAAGKKEPLVQLELEDLKKSGAQLVRDAFDADREGFSVAEFSKTSGISYQRVYGAIVTYKLKLGL